MANKITKKMWSETANRMRLIRPDPSAVPDRTLGPASFRLNRRTFLRGAGTAGLALPFLESIPERSAFAQDATPTFGLFVMTACGVVGKSFGPSATGALTTAGMAAETEKATAVLADHAERLLIVRGMSYAGSGSGCSHAVGLAKSLTGGGTSGGGNNVVASNESCDSVIAKGLGVNPMTLYAGLKEGYIDEKLSFSAPGQVRAAEGNPYNVYLDLAGLLKPGTPGAGTGGGSSSGGPSGVADYLAVRRKSVNDLVRGDLQSLMNDHRISAADKKRLENHLQSIRDLENQMMDMGDEVVGMGLACSGDNLDMAALEQMNSGGQFNPYFESNGTIEEVVKLHLELTAIAFACNTTRVATLQAGDGTDATRYTINGQLYERFHHISHRINSDGSSGSPIDNAEAKHHDIDVLRMQTLKHGIEKWETYDTPAGPLLDNGFIYWSSHVAEGPTHSFNNLPVIIAGSGGGMLKQGACVDTGGISNGKLLNTLINANGVESASFGEQGQGLVSEMLANG